MRFQMTFQNDGDTAFEVPTASLLENPSVGSVSVMPGQSGTVQFDLSGSDTGREASAVRVWAEGAGASLTLTVAPYLGG